MSALNPNAMYKGALPFMLRFLTIVTFCFVGMACNQSGIDEDFHVYLCFGQSNMEGQGIIEDEDLTAVDRFEVLQALDCPQKGQKYGEWRPAIPPLCQCETGLSPADYFGRKMIENLPMNKRVGVINVAVGGCDIRLFDKDLYEAYDSSYTSQWYIDKIEGYGGNPYQHLVELAKLAQQDGVIKGILLHQGETNTGDEAWPEYVHKVYNNLLTDLSLEAESVPLIAGQVVSVDTSCCAKMNKIIDRLPEQIPTSHVVSSDGCTIMDRAHFDSEGYREIGRRYAAKMLEIQ